MKTPEHLLDLTGRVAVVTGGAGHIGREVAAGLAGCGAAIALLDIDEERAAAEARRIGENLGVDSMGIGCDVGEEADVVRAMGAVDRRFGRLDVLVNNAAYPPRVQGEPPPDGQALEDQDLRRWRASMAVIVDGTFLVCRAAAPLLRASPAGSVINMASIYGIVGPQLTLYEGCPDMVNPAYYAAAKGGIIQLTRYLAASLAPRVRVNAISPGGVSRGQPERFRQRYEERVLLGRMAVEADLVGAVLFLASDMSRYVTGHNLVVDGGWSIV